jgi:hypothetical protein
MRVYSVIDAGAAMSECDLKPQGMALDALREPKEAQKFSSTLGLGWWGLRVRGQPARSWHQLPAALTCSDCNLDWNTKQAADWEELAQPTVACLNALIAVRLSNVKVSSQEM